MKSLYMVKLYSLRANAYQTVLVTVNDAQTISHAEKEVKDAHSNDWRISSSCYICETPNDVYTEL